MSNILAKLQLRDYALILLNVEANPDFSPEDGDQVSSTMGVNFNFFRKDGEPKFKIELDVNINPLEKDFKKAEYRVHIKLWSFLEFDPSFPESDILKLLIPNGLAMTYSIARGIVGQATGTSLHNKFILPSVNFVELINDRVAREKKSRKRKLVKK